jgi:SOS-response transcriptional repressor LexA
VQQLTKRQAQVLFFVQAGLAYGEAPTLREIGLAMGIRSTNGVSDHLRALERKGWLRLANGRVRGIQIREWHPAAPVPEAVRIRAKLGLAPSASTDEVLGQIDGLVRRYVS